jgi:hypothetical protein
VSRQEKKRGGELVLVRNGEESYLRGGVAYLMDAATRDGVFHLRDGRRDKGRPLAWLIFFSLQL